MSEGQTTITITGVDPTEKRRLMAACVTADTSVSACLRACIPQIIAELENPQTTTRQDLETELAIMERNVRHLHRALDILAGGDREKIYAALQASEEERGQHLRAMMEREND